MGVAAEVRVELWSQSVGVVRVELWRYSVDVAVEVRVELYMEVIVELWSQSVVEVVELEQQETDTVWRWQMLYPAEVTHLEHGYGCGHPLPLCFQCRAVVAEAEC